jgi:hypothetical protein
MKKQLLTIAILTFLTFWGVKRIHFLYQMNNLEKINRARTHTQNYVLDMDYQKNIKTQMYLMTTEQVCVLFKDNTNEVPEKWYFNEKPSHLRGYVSYKKPLYLVIRIKNEGEKSFFGKVIYRLPSTCCSSQKNILRCPGKSNTYVNYAFYYFSSYQLDKPGYPDLSLTWEEIYVEPDKN